ncbi:hypothetical protein AAHE18_10G129500 [Arachis hypogaea]
MMGRLGKTEKDLIKSSIRVTDFNGKTSSLRGVVLLSIEVGFVNRPTLFVVVPSKAGFNLLLGRDWIHGMGAIPSTFHQKLIFWNEDGGVEEVLADNSTCYYDEMHVEFRMYNPGVKPLTVDTNAFNPENIEMCKIDMNDREGCTDSVPYDCIYDDGPLGFEKNNNTDTVKKVEVQDPLEEVDIGNGDYPRPTYVSKMLPDDFKKELVEILKEYCDCFAWDYAEMPGLSCELVEHQLPLKANVKHNIKEEIERLLKAKFIRTAMYVNWISNIVPVMKNNEKLRVCIDFRDLNSATPKDEYPMPIVDMLIDSTTGHEMLNFMDGYSGYNQIYIVEEDVSKTAFRCPGALETFEWVVMPFGLKNVGATYQRAMNKIFHDFIENFMEIYVDDVVVKSNVKKEHLENLKMNPLKCAFGKKGIEIDKNKAKAILEAPPPANKKQLQAFLGKVNYLRRFISKLSGKTKIFAPLIKLKKEEEHGAPLKLYVLASEVTIGGMLAQEDENGNERVIYYLSRVLNDVESRYSPIEKLCLALYFSYLKLKYYLIPRNVYVISKFDVLKYMLSSPILHGRLGKWMLALTEFSLHFIPARAVKGQVLADFLVDHPCIDIDENLLSFVSLVPWKLYFDGSCHKGGVGIGILIISPSGEPSKFLFELNYSCSNNETEYEALIMGLELLLEREVKNVKIFGDSQHVVRQVSLEYRCVSENLRKYFNVTTELLSKFDSVIVRHVPRELNQEANELAQIASRYKIKPSTLEKLVRIKDIFMPLREREVLSLEKLDPEDWRVPIVEYLKNPSLSVDRKLKYRAQSYVLISNTCLGEKEAYLTLAKVHEGICGAHQSREKMKWVINRRRLYWPTIQRDCINYARSSSELHVIIKPWPFRGWALDLIGQIHLPTSKGHKFILVGVDYFSKWVEAIPLREEHIVHRFGIPQSITTDQGTMFIGKKVMEYAKSRDIKMLSSTPYYAQANGQAAKKLAPNSQSSFWAYQNSPRGSTRTTPYKLVYGHDAVLPIDINLQSIRVARQDEIPVVDYWDSLHDELNELDDERLRALERVIRQKEIMSKSYNRRVKAKTFAVGDLVWKTILPIERKSKTYGKWSPTWEGPYVVDKVYPGNAYKIIEIGSRRRISSINGKYLKVYRPDIHEINIPHA